MNIAHSLEPDEDGQRS